MSQKSSIDESIAHIINETSSSDLLPKDDESTNKMPPLDHNRSIINEKSPEGT